MVSSEEVDFKILRMAIQLKYFDEKKENGKCNVRSFRRLFFRMSCNVPAFKVLVSPSDFEFRIGVNKF